MRTLNHEHLSKRIEQVIHEHLEECRQAAQTALCRAFLAADRVAPQKPSGPKAKVEEREKAAYRRRTADEMSAAAGKLYEAICAKPGTTMAALALQMGVPSQHLGRPMAALKRDHKVRHIGERSQRQYFPLTPDTA